MNIHEHQAKEIFRKFNIKVPHGTVVFSLEEIDQKFKTIKTSTIALKAQIHVEKVLPVGRRISRCLWPICTRQ